MKRLVRQANLTLSHATRFESFINICKDGEIRPYNQTDHSGHSNSLDPNSIYLTRYSGGEFADDFMRDDKYNIGVCLDVNVDEDSLLPSYDIFEFETVGDEFDNKEELTWEDTLDEWDECRYTKSIPLTSVTKVFISTNNRDVITQYQQYVNKSIAIDEAIEFVNKFNHNNEFH